MKSGSRHEKQPLFSWKKFMGPPKFCGPWLISGSVWAIWPFEIYGNPALVSVWSTPSARAVDRCLEEKKLTPKDDTPYNVGPKKGQWFLEGWNLSPPKTDEITSVTNFDKYKLYDRPFLKGVGQPTWWKPNSKFINRNFPTLFAPKALGNVHLPKKDDFSGDFYESC